MKKFCLISVLVSLVLFMGCKQDSADDVNSGGKTSGDGKSPIQLQLKTGEYVVADWQYPQFHKEYTFDNGTKTGMTSVNWQYCTTGKDCELILNFNPNNGYYMIRGGQSDRSKYNKDMFRSYTVEELENMIGTLPQTVSRAVFVGVDGSVTETITCETDFTFKLHVTDTEDNSDMDVIEGTYFGDTSKDGDVLVTFTKRFDESTGNWTELNEGAMQVTISDGTLILWGMEYIRQ